MVLPDHPTPIRVRTHTGDSVPYMLYDSSNRWRMTGIIRKKQGGKAESMCPRDIN